MPLTEADKRTAVHLVFREPFIRLCCRRDEPRMRRIVDIVWNACQDCQPKQREPMAALSRARLESSPNYTDTVSFIPIWLLGIIIRIIIDILVDYWLAHEYPNNDATE